MISPYCRKTCLSADLSKATWAQWCSLIAAGKPTRSSSLLVLEPQPEGGYTVTSPLLAGLVTEGDTLEEAFHNVQDAFRPTLEIYEDTGKPLPAALQLLPENATIVLEHAVAVS
jgi:antitoxin HicB